MKRKKGWKMIEYIINFCAALGFFTITGVALLLCAVLYDSNMTREVRINQFEGKGNR